MRRVINVVISAIAPVVLHNDMSVYQTMMLYLACLFVLNSIDFMYGDTKK